MNIVHEAHLAIYNIYIARERGDYYYTMKHTYIIIYYSYIYVERGGLLWAEMNIVHEADANTQLFACSSSFHGVGSSLITS